MPDHRCLDCRHGFHEGCRGSDCWCLACAHEEEKDLRDLELDSIIYPVKWV